MRLEPSLLCNADLAQRLPATLHEYEGTLISRDPIMISGEIRQSFADRGYRV